MKLIALIYKCIWVVFFRCLNLFSLCVCRLVLFLNRCKVGKHLRVYGGCPQIRISLGAKMVKIGDYVTLNNYNDVGWGGPCAIWVKENASLEIGDNSGLNGALVYASEGVCIGKNVKIGGGSKIFDTDFHPLDYVNRRISNQGTKAAPVIIEDDVFIGSSCLILKGVTVGNRSIIAAGSVVSKSIPSGEIWGGNPARFIKKI